MANQNIKLLKSVDTLYLAAGHGGVDPGAVNGQNHEAKQVRFILPIVADMLRSKGIKVETQDDGAVIKAAANKATLVAAINHVNNRYAFGKVWAIQLHRNSGGVSGSVADRSFWTCFYGGDGDSEAVATALTNAFKKHGADGSSRNFDDRKGRFGRLGWIRDVRPLSHIIEMGFMQGDNSEQHLRNLAEITAKGIYEVFTGQSWPNNQPQPQAPSWSSPHGIEASPEFQYINQLNQQYAGIVTSNNVVTAANWLADRDKEIKEFKIKDSQNLSTINQLNEQVRQLQERLNSVEIGGLTPEQLQEINLCISFTKSVCDLTKQINSDQLNSI